MIEDKTEPGAATIRVLMITSRSDQGGGPRHVLDLLRGLKSHPEIVTFLAAPSNPPYGDLLRKEVRASLEIRPRSFAMTDLIRLKRFAEDQRIDIIHSHGRAAGFYGRVLGAWTGLPCVHTFHGVHTGKGLLSRLKLLLEQTFALLPVQVAIASSEDESERAFRHHLSEKKIITVIPNAVDLRRWTQTRPTRGTPPLRVGSLTRPDPAKGVDRLIHSWIAFRRSAPNQEAELHLAGLSWDQTTDICGCSEEELRRERIAVHGETESPLDFLATLDVFASASRSEGMPLAVLEAMMIPLPCLLSQIEGHAPFFAAGSALPFDPETEGSFTDAMLKLLPSEARQALAMQGRQTVEQKHSLETQAARTSGVYADLHRTERGATS